MRDLSEDSSQESRIRALAYGWLRANGFEVPRHKLLGVVIEVALTEGLDVLAAFSDGGVRYINQTGRLAVVEGGRPEVQAAVARLLTASQPVIERLGPWKKQRLPPPPQGHLRLTFLVSDGLYFGNGPIDAMEREPLAALVVREGAQLLQLVVAASLDKKGPLAS